MKKAVDFLTKKEKQIVLNCLHEATEGPFFPDWEFQTLIGVERDDVRLATLRLKQNASTVDDGWIITNILNNLTGYPHDEFERWHEHFDFSIQDAEAILTKLLSGNKKH
jgi:hypothetical protein